MNSFIKDLLHKIGARLQMTPVDETKMTNGGRLLCFDKFAPEKLHFYFGLNASFAAYEETPRAQLAAEDFCTQLEDYDKHIYDTSVLEIVIDGSRQVLSRSPAKLILSWTMNFPSPFEETKIVYRAEGFLL